MTEITPNDSSLVFLREISVLQFSSTDILSFIGTMRGWQKKDKKKKKSSRK